MKKDIHPKNYRIVAFKDMSNDHVFLCRSAVNTKETLVVDGVEYPVYALELVLHAPKASGGEYSFFLFHKFCIFKMTRQIYALRHGKKNEPYLFFTKSKSPIQSFVLHLHGVKQYT